MELEPKWLQPSDYRKVSDFNTEFVPIGGVIKHNGRNSSDAYRTCLDGHLCFVSQVYNVLSTRQGVPCQLRETEQLETFAATVKRQNRAADAGLAPHVRYWEVVTKTQYNIMVIIVYADLLVACRTLAREPRAQQYQSAIHRVLCDLKKLNIQHNDIHLGNIMVNPYSGRVWLIDFGCSSTWRDDTDLCDLKYRMSFV